ncbi:MAG TPA: tetratricopeptide repeat protein [Acidobacteriota bacterium]|jgi:tetratricopeptide (TPR) repeat protein
MKCEDADLTGFLNSDLDPDHTAAVAGHLEQCPDCHERLLLLMEIRQNRTELQRLKKHSRPHALVWPIAAAIVFMVLLGFWVGLRAPSPRQLAVNTPYPLVPPELRTSRVSSEFLEAMRAYSNRNWPLAESKFQRYLAADPLNYDAAFYLANVEYVLGKYSESERILTQLATRNPGDDRVQWYLANGRLKQGDRNGAKAVLEKLAGGSGEFTDQAKSLLRRIRR